MKTALLFFYFFYFDYHYYRYYHHYCIFPLQATQIFQQEIWLPRCQVALSYHLYKVEPYERLHRAGCPGAFTFEPTKDHK